MIYLNSWKHPRCQPVAQSMLCPQRAGNWTPFREVTMIRLIAIAGFAVSIAVSAQAMTVAPTIAQPDSMVTEVAAACGVGRTRINGVCVA